MSETEELREVFDTAMEILLRDRRTSDPTSRESALVAALGSLHDRIRLLEQRNPEAP